MSHRFTEQFQTIYDMAVRLSSEVDADALLVLLDGPCDWARLKKLAGAEKVVVAVTRAEHAAGAAEADIESVVVGMPDGPVYERLTQSVLEAVAEEVLIAGGHVVAVYSGFEPGVIDSISLIRLDEHLRRLTVRDLRQLETRVPLETLKCVIDLCVEIGREGREGKPVGTIFVVGDTKRVLLQCSPSGYDPVRGYKRNERNLFDPRVREGVKEIAQLDGAFVVSSDGTVERSCQLLDTSVANITLSKGLGARHWAAAAVSKKTSAVAVAVSESNGTVRIFQNGEVVLRIEPFRRAMKWKDFEYEPPPSADS